MLGMRRCIAGDPHSGRAFTDTGPKFTEPVALSSTQPADRPLPRRAFELRFDLVALRARCIGKLQDVPVGVKCTATGIVGIARFSSALPGARST